MIGRIEVSVVVPCYNESGNIPALIARLQAVCEASVGGSYEIVLVNDGSRDTTFALISQASAEDPHIVGVSLARNFGHQRALSAGLAEARATGYSSSMPICRTRQNCCLPC